MPRTIGADGNVRKGPIRKLWLKNSCIQRETHGTDRKYRQSLVRDCQSERAAFYIEVEWKKLNFNGKTCQCLFRHLRYKRAQPYQVKGCTKEGTCKAVQDKVREFTLDGKWSKWKRSHSSRSYRRLNTVSKPKRSKHKCQMRDWCKILKKICGWYFRWFWKALH